MAEEEDKKNAQTNQNDPAQKTGDSANSQKTKKKRRRRPRKKKPIQEEQPKESKTRTRHRPKKRKSQKTDEEVNIIDQVPDENPAAAADDAADDNNNIFALDEPEINTEVETQDIEDTDDTTEEFLSSDDEGDQPVVDELELESETVPEPVAPPPELPEEIAGNEKPEGPVGWDQLKDAIKKDHIETKKKVATGEGVPTLTEEPKIEETQAEEQIPEVIPAEISTEPAPEPEVEPEVVSEPETTQFVPGAENLAADDEAEKQEIIRIIIKYAVGGCALIAIIAGIFLFNIPGTIYNFASDLFNDGETIKEQPIKTETPDRTNNDLTDGTGTAIISGGQIPKVRKVPSSVQTLFKVGFPEVTSSDSDKITTYLQVLSELQNGFETDINQLLDSSANRANTLEIHLRELNGLIAEAQFTYETLKEEVDEIKIDYNKVTTKKDALEESFFVALDKLAANESNLILNDFIEVSKDQVDLKAQFNSLTKISGLFDTAIKNMEARIKDIQANKQALVKGVKIVDIKGSDLDLIIQEGEL